MKKDEGPKVNTAKERTITKNELKIQATKTQASKSFLGCNTCKLKNNATTKKNKSLHDEHRIKKNIELNPNNKNQKIKLTDLCDEDKKRIVELMEELSKFAEKNRNLKESLDLSEKAKQEQHDCLLKQTSLHLEEKNMYLKEIQSYKSRLEGYESELREKMTKWESRERFMDSEIRYLAKALQKSFNEKSDLMKEISHLKACLRQSLESFELLRNEVATLQRLSVKSPTPSSRNVLSTGEKKDLDVRAGESEDEYISATKENTESKRGLDVCNNALEQLYVLLQSKVPEKSPSEKITVAASDDIEKPLEKQDAAAGVAKDLDVLMNEHQLREEKSQNAINRNTSVREESDAKTCESNYKFLKPFNECNKTSIQAGRILKKIKKPFSFECDEMLGKSKNSTTLDEELGYLETKFEEAMGDGLSGSKCCSKMMKDEFDEDRLLSDLFYSEATVNLELESMFPAGIRENITTGNFLP